MHAVVELRVVDQAAERPRQDSLYGQFAAAFGPAVERLARGYEAHEARRQDLVQEIHLAVWRSLATFDERCSLRTWTYRVAHNVAVSHVLRDRKARELVSLVEAEDLPGPATADEDAERSLILERLMALVRSLTPI